MTVELMSEPYLDEETLDSLEPVVRKWFTGRFKDLAPPQKYSILNIRNRLNTLISSPTGSGKTLSAFLTIISELVRYSNKDELLDKVYCVYVSPLKALANDISRNLLEPLREIEACAGKSLRIKVAIRTGDTTSSERKAMLAKSPHILITTPESLAIMLSTTRFREKLLGVEWVIVDEIHALAASKRGSHLSISLERLQSQAHFTRIGLSATVAPLEEVAKFLVGFDMNAGKERSCKIVDVNYAKQLDLKVISPVKSLIDTTNAEISNATYRLIDELVQCHKTTLIFTNTRSATERVVHHLKTRFPQNYTEIDEEDSPGEIETEAAYEEVDSIALKELAREEEKQNLGKNYSSAIKSEQTTGAAKGIKSLIGAHHGSLSREHRLNVEEKLKAGKLKAVVTSTSLELGIDIGYIDLVILLGSPKSVARALQRIGRSGHKLHEKAVGRIIVSDRDDLVECSVLLKAAIERRIDSIDIPLNCMDVLAQQVLGITLEEAPKHVDSVFSLIKGSYTYNSLSKEKFLEVVSYLAGEYASLQERKVFAKIWFDKDTKLIGKKGKLARVIYMTNIGTIPDETSIKVKVDSQVVGSIAEPFLEKLRRGDTFVLGGNTYEFLHTKGMTAYVRASVNKPPTVPSWYSEMLPLSFGLALEVQKFRRLMEENLKYNDSREDTLAFIRSYLYVDENSTLSLYEYFIEQFDYAQIPHDKKILIEHYSDGTRKRVIFHTLYGRRVNDVLSRAVAYAISRVHKKDVELGISDNGFYLAFDKSIPATRAFSMIKSHELGRVMVFALEKTEVLSRRFRHCAARALMILRAYKGSTKSVGRQQMSSRLLLSSVKRISSNFPILEEARREVLEDLMDVKNAKLVLSLVEEGQVQVQEAFTDIPSPFAFNLLAMGYSDILKVEDKIEFLKRMHSMVLAKIDLGKKRAKKA